MEKIRAGIVYCYCTTYHIKEERRRRKMEMIKKTMLKLIAISLLILSCFPVITYASGGRDLDTMTLEEIKEYVRQLVSDSCGHACGKHPALRRISS